MEKTLEIRLASYARTLGPRVLAQEILQQALGHIRAEVGTNVLFIFEGLDRISSGFSYELFGGLRIELGNEFKERVRIRFGANPNEAMIKQIIFQAMQAATEPKQVSG